MIPFDVVPATSGLDIELGYYRSLVIQKEMTVFKKMADAEPPDVILQYLIVLRNTQQKVHELEGLK